MSVEIATPPELTGGATERNTVNTQPLATDKYTMTTTTKSTQRRFTRDSAVVLDLLDKGYSVMTQKEKAYPPPGFTGYDGRLSTHEDFGSSGNNFVSLRLFDTVGFDVDTDLTANHKDYNPELADLWREFLDTFNISPVVTGANLNNLAGIYHFSYGPGVTEVDVQGVKIDCLDIIRRGWHFAVIRGTHPNGKEYKGDIPAKDELPVLTREMVAWLQARSAQALPTSWQTVTTDWQTQGTCAAVQSVVDSFVPDEKSRHNSFLRIVYRLACMGAAGHYGVEDAIDTLRGRFAQYEDKNIRDFERMLQISRLPVQSPVVCKTTTCKQQLPSTTAVQLFNHEHPHYAFSQNASAVTEYLMWHDGWEIVTKVQLKGYLTKFVSPRQLNETLNTIEGLASNNPAPPVPFGILPCKNGLLNLDTGEFLPHSKTVAGIRSTVDYDPAATAPRFTNEFLPSFAPDRETQKLFLSIMKEILRGGNAREKLLILKGRGGVGKGIFLEIMRLLCGRHLSTVHQGKSLTDTPKDGNSASPEVAAMEGKRLIVVDELDEKISVLNAARVKQITGRSLMSGRKLYEGIHEFRVTGMLVISTNRTPRFRDDAEGIDRRVIFYKVPDRTGAVDPSLKQDIVEKELSGILNMILAADDWDEKGTLSPVVQAMTDKYILDMDMIASFVDDCLEPVEQRRHGDKLSDIYPAFEAWCQEERGGRAIGKQAFRDAMEDKGYDFKDVMSRSNVAMMKLNDRGNSYCGELD